MQTVLKKLLADRSQNFCLFEQNMVTRIKDFRSIDVEMRDLCKLQFAITIKNCSSNFVFSNGRVEPQYLVFHSSASTTTQTYW